MNNNDKKIQIDSAIHTEIDDLQKHGYRILGVNKIAACQIWQMAWDLISQLMQNGQFASIEELDKAYHGYQSIENWAGDYSLELRSAGFENSAYWQQCLDFLSQYLAYSRQQDNLHNQTRRRLIAECTFSLGQIDEGDALFKAYLAQNPQWGRGWISWAGQYNFYPSAVWYDLGKAETILRQALEIKDVAERSEIVILLQDILIRQGRTIEASRIE